MQRVNPYQGVLMPSQLEQIRDQQRETWDKFSSGWKKWDELVLNWLAPVGQDLIRSAALEDDSNVLDVAAGTGEPGLTAATLVPKGMVTVTDLSDRMLEVAAENAGRRKLRNFQTKQCDAGALPLSEKAGPERPFWRLILPGLFPKADYSSANERGQGARYTWPPRLRAQFRADFRPLVSGH